MRLIFALLMVFGMMAPAAVGIAAADEASSVIAMQQQPAPQAPSGQIDVDIDTDSGGAWWTNPIWIGIGVVVLIAIIALIVAASRGGGTTVVKG